SCKSHKSVPCSGTKPAPCEPFPAVPKVTADGGTDMTLVTSLWHGSCDRERLHHESKKPQDIPADNSVYGIVARGCVTRPPIGGIRLASGLQPTGFFLPGYSGVHPRRRRGYPVGLSSSNSVVAIW